MPSPFPGMNPFLEHEDAWQDFHETYIPALREALSPQVSPSFVVKVEEHIFIHEPPASERIRVGNPDLGVLRSRGQSAKACGESLSVVAPARILIPSIEFEKQSYLEVRDRQNRELVCAIELLSPTNKKPGPDREQYLAKRAKLLRSPAHFVEIDLLRGWPRMPMEQAQPCDYCILVSRAEERPDAGFWPVGLREVLPVIPIPLRPPLAQAYLNLQEILHLVYDRAYYKDYIYQNSPQPALSADDASWAASLINAK